jgi:hypothetical protein
MAWRVFYSCLHKDADLRELLGTYLAHLSPWYAARFVLMPTCTREHANVCGHRPSGRSEWSRFSGRCAVSLQRRIHFLTATYTCMGQMQTDFLRSLILFLSYPLSCEAPLRPNGMGHLNLVLKKKRQLLPPNSLQRSVR